MLPTDRDAFATTLTSALGMYDREANDATVDTWMATLKAFDLARVRSALKDHMEHAEDGKRAPRPVDIWRRLTHGGGKGTQCAAVAPDVGRCQFPGVFSDSTDGSGQWYCPWHRSMRSGPDAVVAIERSSSLDFADVNARRIELANIAAVESPAVKRLRAAVTSRKPGNAFPAMPLRQPGEDDAEACAA